MEDEVYSKSFMPELTGRREEKGRLELLWKKVLSGKGSTVLISGEAGIGKTRLVTELMKFAENDKAEIIKGWCLADTLEPLMPFIEALRDADLYQLISEEPPPKVISAYLINADGILVNKAERGESDLDPDIFASMLTAVGNFVGDSLSMIGEDGANELNSIGYGEHDILIQTVGSLSLAVVIEGEDNEFLINDMVKTLYDIGDQLSDWDGNVKRAEEIAPKISWFVDSGKYEGKYLVDDPKIKQENLFDNVLMGIQRLSSDQPVILFLDDIQWADHSSLKLLHYLARNTREYKVMIICTYRPEDVMRLDDEKTHPLKTTMQNMSREGLFEEIKLERLDESTVKEFIKRTLGELDINDEFVKKIYGECEGNPFFLLEVIQMLVGEGYLTEENGLWSAEGTTDDIHIPSKIYDVVVRRLDRLIGEQRDLLECASVVGDEFESGVVGEMAGINRIKLLKNLNDIERTHNLIHSVKKKYRFDHNKIREVLYTSINQELREEYHRVVAESYERLYSDTMDEALVHIAHHYYNAGDERGVEYLLDAGDKAVERYANEEGVILYNNALSLMDGNDMESQKRALEGLGDLFYVISGYDKALERYRSVLDFVKDDKEKGLLYGKIASALEKIGKYGESLEYAEKGLSLVDTDDVESCMLLNNKGWALMRLGKYDEAINVFIEGMEHADMLHEMKEKGESLHDLGTVYLRRGDFDRGEDYLEKAIELRNDIGDLLGLGASYNNMGLISWNKGESDKSLTYFQQCKDIFEKIGGKLGIATALNNIGVLLWVKGDLDRALEHYQRSHDIEEEIGDKLGIATSIHNIGAIYRDKGELNTCIDHLQRSFNIVKDIDDKWGIATSTHNIGVVHRIKGELDEALGFHERSLEIRKEIGDKKGIVESMCGVVETCLKKKDMKKAEEDIKEALDLAVEIGGKGEETMCRKIMGMVYRELEDWEKAEVEFEKGIEMLQGEGDKKNLSVTYYEYGLMWKARGEVEKAVGYLEKALSFFEEAGMKLWAERTREAIASY